MTDLANNPALVAKKFWTIQEKYPEFSCIPKRQLKKVSWIMEHIEDGIKSICDICAGDGDITYLLSQFIELEKVFLFDCNKNLLNIAENKFHINYKNKNSDLDVTTIKCDLAKNDVLFPHTDVTLFLGSMHYIFDDVAIDRILTMVNSEQLVIAAPCTMKSEDELINKFSEAAGDNYAALYRTLEHVKTLIERNGFRINACERLYPDSIESKFGTKQFVFNCYCK